MVFPIFEPEDGDDRTGCNQNQNGVIDLRPNASDPDFGEEHFDELSEAFFLKVWQRPKKRNMRLKNLFPRSGKRPSHDFQSPQALSPDKPIYVRAEAQSEKHGREEPACNHACNCHHARKREGAVAVSPIVCRGHEQFRVLQSRICFRIW